MTAAAVFENWKLYGFDFADLWIFSSCRRKLEMRLKQNSYVWKMFTWFHFTNINFVLSFSFPNEQPLDLCNADWRKIYDQLCILLYVANNRIETL